MANAADGQPWTELHLLPTRALNLAHVSCCLHGVSTLVQVLHAAHPHGEADTVPTWLADCTVDRLFHASRRLLESAGSTLLRRGE